jgi:hypothetical protein
VPAVAATHESALISLAILKVNHDADRDYISNFVPFVAQVIREAPHDEISVAEVQKGVIAQFALKIPQGALNTILHRACRGGYIEKRRGIYRRCQDKLADLNLGAVRAQVARQQGALLKELANFAREKYDMDWDVTEAERALLAFLPNRSSAILAAAIDGTAITAAKPIDHSELIVNSFVVDVSESNPDAFEFLVTLVKGSMLADVLYLPGTFEGAQRKFDKTKFYLDTSFVLRAIGFATREASEPAKELLGLLEKQCVRLRMFEHSRDELLAILDYNARALTPGSQLPLSPPAEFLRSEGWTASDVEDFIAKVPIKLSALGIEVVSKPGYKKRLGIDETGLEQALKDALPEQREEARRRDIDSLAAIMRLRRGGSTHGLENCGAVLVTTNGALVRTASAFFRTSGNRAGVSPVIHAHELTWIAWLKLPTAAPDLPRMQVIADSFAALNPPEDLWLKYTHQIAHLREQGEVSNEEFHILRYSIEARRALLTKTLGNPDVFTEGNIPEILQAARSEITAELRQELEAERANNAAQTHRDNELLASERSAREQEEAKRSEVEAKVAERQREREDSITLRAEAVGSKAAHILFVAAAVFLAIATFFASDALMPSSVRTFLPGIVSVAFFVVATFSVLNGVFGLNLVDLRERCAQAISERVSVWLRKLGE